MDVRYQASRQKLEDDDKNPSIETVRESDIDSMMSTDEKSNHCLYRPASLQPSYATTAFVAVSNLQKLETVKNELRADNAFVMNYLAKNPDNEDSVLEKRRFIDPDYA